MEPSETTGGGGPEDVTVSRGLCWRVSVAETRDTVGRVTASALEGRPGVSCGDL